VVAHLEEAGASKGQPVHVINVNIVDNPEDATLGAFHFCDLMAKLASCEDLDDEISHILNHLEKKSEREHLHMVSFYWSNEAFFSTFISVNSDFIRNQWEKKNEFLELFSENKLCHWE